jgi:hypothetical protein
MKDIDCPEYAPIMLQRFAIWYGRIGALCDECPIAKCRYNPMGLSAQGIKNGYGCLKEGRIKQKEESQL